MADSIKPVDAIGDPAVRAVSGYQYPHASERGDASRQVPRPESTRMRLGAPADVVELSVDAQTLNALPPMIHLRFLVDSKHNSVVVQLIDSTTNEVIRQVPPRQLRETLRDLL